MQKNKLQPFTEPRAAGQAPAAKNKQREPAQAHATRRAVAGLTIRSTLKVGWQRNRVARSTMRVIVPLIQEN